MSVHKTIIIVRHGETYGNAKGLVKIDPELYTSADYTPPSTETLDHLNPRGQSQARHVGERLTREYRIDTAFCSTLARCRQTIGAILDAHKSANGHASAPFPVRYLDDLREFEIGTDDTHDYIAKRAEHEKADGERDSFRYSPAGESGWEFKRRVENACETILAEPSPTVLVVGHGGTNAYLLLLLQQDRDGIWATQYNCCINALQFNSASQLITPPVINDVNHIPESLRKW